MFITPQLIKEKGSCEVGVKYAEEHFPDGIDALEFLNKEGANIPTDVLQWAMEYLPASDEEYHKAEELLGILNSTNVSYGMRVHDSEYVVDSSSVEKSKFVFNSRIIINSCHVVGSSSVHDSHAVYLSKFVNNSTDVMASTNVKESNNIVNSKYVIRCKDINGSDLVTDCSQITNCHNGSSLHFCGNLTGCSHMLFCYSMENESYRIFNIQVSEEQFNMALENYKELMGQYSAYFMDSLPDDLVYADTPRVRYDRRVWFEKLPGLFLEWVESLPGYNKDIMYYLTMLPEFWK